MDAKDTDSEVFPVVMIDLLYVLLIRMTKFTLLILSQFESGLFLLFVCPTTFHSQTPCHLIDPTLGEHHSRVSLSLDIISGAYPPLLRESEP